MIDSHSCGRVRIPSKANNKQPQKETHIVNYIINNHTNILIVSYSSCQLHKKYISWTSWKDYVSRLNDPYSIPFTFLSSFNNLSFFLVYISAFCKLYVWYCMYGIFVDLFYSNKSSSQKNIRYTQKNILFISDKFSAELIFHLCE